MSETETTKLTAYLGKQRSDAKKRIKKKGAAARGRVCAHLHSEGAKHDGAEDGVPEDAVKDVALAVDLPGVDLVEELHHDEGVEDDGVVLGRRRVQGGVAAAVDVKDLLAWSRGT